MAKEGGQGVEKWAAARGETVGKRDHAREPRTTTIGDQGRDWGYLSSKS